jgi:hypothetical protein
MNKALAGTALKGVPNNLQFLQQLVKEPRFVAGNTTTRFLEDFHFTPRVMEVVAPGELRGCCQAELPGGVLLSSCQQPRSSRPGRPPVMYTVAGGATRQQGR